MKFKKILSLSLLGAMSVGLATFAMSAKTNIQGASAAALEASFTVPEFLAANPSINKNKYNIPLDTPYEFGPVGTFTNLVNGGTDTRTWNDATEIRTYDGANIKIDLDEGYAFDSVKIGNMSLTTASTKLGWSSDGGMYVIDPALNVNTVTVQGKSTITKFSYSYHATSNDPYVTLAESNINTVQRDIITLNAEVGKFKEGSDVSYEWTVAPEGALERVSTATPTASEQFKAVTAGEATISVTATGLDTNGASFTTKAAVANVNIAEFVLIPPTIKVIKFPQFLYVGQQFGLEATPFDFKQNEEITYNWSAEPADGIKQLDEVKTNDKATFEILKPGNITITVSASGLNKDDQAITTDTHTLTGEAKVVITPTELLAKDPATDFDFYLVRGAFGGYQGSNGAFIVDPANGKGLDMHEFQIQGLSDGQEIFIKGQRSDFNGKPQIKKFSLEGQNDVILTINAPASTISNLPNALNSFVKVEKARITNVPKSFNSNGTNVEFKVGTNKSSIYFQKATESAYNQLKNTLKSFNSDQITLNISGIAGEYNSKGNLVYTTAMKFELVRDEFVNYVLAENNEGQCVTRFGPAHDLFDSLSDKEKTDLQNSKNEREQKAMDRYIDWSKALNKDAGLVGTQSNNIELMADTTIITVIIALSLLAISSIVIVKIIKSKKTN